MSFQQEHNFEFTCNFAHREKSPFRWREPLKVRFLFRSLCRKRQAEQIVIKARDSGELRIARRFPDLPQLDLSKFSLYPILLSHQRKSV